MNNNLEFTNINKVNITLLDGQLELILRSMELYGYNLEYMLNESNLDDEQRQEKIAMLKYTYEQMLAAQAEQVQTKSNNRENLSKLGKLMLKDMNNTNDTPKLKVL